MRSKLYLFIILSLLASCGPAWDVRKDGGEKLRQEGAQPSGDASGLLKIIIFDVGEGDSALLVSPDGEAALIDTGPFGSSSRRGELPRLKYLFISHPDNDHNGDLANIGIAPVEASAGDSFYLGDDVELSILAADCVYSDGAAAPCEEDDDNAHSMAVLVRYGMFKYLTAGDLPGGGGNPPYQTIDMETHLGELAGDVDVLHVGHHGSNTSTNQSFLDLVTPEAAVISVGNNNDYWHPHPSVVRRLVDGGIKTYQTERGWLKGEFLGDIAVMNGDITIESDGLTFSVR